MQLSRNAGAIARRPRFVTSTVAVLLSVLLVACRDTPTEPRTQERVVRPSELASHATAVNDPGINTNDTWVNETDVVAESTTVTAVDPFLDPATNQMVTSLTVGTEPEVVNVVAGYGFDGQPHATTGFDTPNPIATALVQQIGNTTYHASENEALSYGTFDVEPIAELGSMDLAQLEPTLDPNDPCATAIDVDLCRQQQGCTSCNRVPSGPGDRVATMQVDATHLRVMQTWSDARAVLADKRTEQNDDATSHGRHSRTKEYEKHGNDWVLTDITEEVVDEDARGSRRQLMRHHLSNVRYHRNAELDAKRRQAAAAAAAARPANASLSLRAPAKPLFDVSCDAQSVTLIIACDEPVGGGASTDPAEPPAPAQTSVISTQELLPPNGGPIALNLEHGFMSDERTWGRMSARLGAAVLHGGMNVPTTPWTASYADQAAQLTTSVESNLGAEPTVFIGHSNGGMISRLLAQQQFGGQAINVQGVITIGSPHWGAPLANAATHVNRLLGVAGAVSFLLCRVTDNTAGCTNFTNATQEAAPWYVAWTTPIPVLDNMRWHSAYHTAFNSVPESFTHFGISSHMWTKWVFWRNWGDLFCYEDSSCGGSKQVQKIDKIYHHDISCSVISSIFLGLRSAAKCVGDAVFLRAFDNLYQNYVKGPFEATAVLGDGVVPASSQLYPNTPAENLFAVEDGPAHTGETGDPRVATLVRNILVGRLNVPPKQ